MGYPASTSTVGILALQGDFGLHRKVIKSLGHNVREVRTPADLEAIDALIVPGGESTTMRKLLNSSGLYDELSRFTGTHPVMGTCAGLILLSRGIDGFPDEPTLGLIDCTVTRNAYGRQFHSFRDVGRLALPGEKERPFEMVFIRAPRITRIGAGVDVLGRLGDEPTIIRQGNILAMAFHPELADDPAVHGFFIRKMCKQVVR